MFTISFVNRAIFLRACHIPMPPKKMKTIFKSFLAFETAHGTEETVEAVRQKATEYVSALK